MQMSVAVKRFENYQCEAQDYGRKDTLKRNAFIAEFEWKSMISRRESWV